MKKNFSFSQISFLGVVLCALIIGVSLAKATLHIGYWPTDSWHLYIPAAKALNHFQYLSDIHKYNIFDSLHQKEILVLGITFFQGLLNDFESIYPNILLLIISLFASSLLFHSILKKWFNPQIATLGFFLFVSCFWPTQYVLQGAHQPLALCFFLAAVYNVTKENYPTLRLFFSGLYLGLMFYSSPTSPVYVPYFLACIYFLNRTRIKHQGQYPRPWIQGLLLLFGFACVFFFVTFPHPIKSLSDYLSFLKASQSQNNFNSPQFFFGEQYPNLSVRGSGITWIIKYIFLVLPVIFPFYLLCIATLGFLARKKPFLLGLILVSLSSPILVELIQVAQFGRNYFSWLIGIITLICFTIYYLHTNFFPTFSKRLKIFCVSLLAIFLVSNTIVNIQIFMFDVFPSRMASDHLYKWFKNNDISSVSTYSNHPYLPNLVDRLNHPKRSDPLLINKITSIREVKSGLILIPPYTGKSIWANCQISDILIDPFFLELAASGEFFKYVVASFPTLSSSVIWTQEEEYCSYLDLHLGQISAVDRLKGMAFILDAGKLQKEWFKAQ